jgi:hypothetical protein
MSQQRKIDGMSEGDPQRANLATLEGGGKRPRTGRGLIALLEQRVDALAQLGELRGPFAPKQVAAQLGLELLDRTRQRRLRHVALGGGAGEIERPRHREKIPDLMHFHDQAPLMPWPI